MAVSFVQHVGAEAGPTPGTSISLTFVSTTVSGNAVIVTVSTFGGTTAVTDNKGNTYTKIDSVTETFTGKILDVWYTSGMVGGATHQVTFTQATNTGYELILEEYSGLIPTAAYDVKVKATGTATTASAGTSPSTTVKNELVWSGIVVYGSQSDLNDLVTTAGAGYSNLGHAGAGSVIIYKESKVVSVIGTQSANFTISAPAGFGPNSPKWAAILITFRAPTTQAIAATVTGVAGMSRLKARFITMAATVAGVATISRINTFSRTLAATVTAVTAIGRRISITLAAIATVLPFMNAAKRVPDVSTKPRINIK